MDDSLPRPPARSGAGMRPAMLVVGIAVVLMLVFGIGAAVSHPGTPSRPSTGRVNVGGTSLRSVPAAGALRPIERAGEPPANILAGVALPAGAVRGASSGAGPSVAQYDAQVHFSVAASQEAVVTFYRTEMKRHGWHVDGPSPATGVHDGVEVLGQKAGSDGWYWEMGAVVSPTTFSGPRQTTPFSLRFFQVSDAD